VDAGARLPVRRIHRQHLPRGLEGRREQQQGLGRPFADEQTPSMAVRRIDHDREPPPLEIKRNFVNLRVARDVRGGFLQRGRVERTPNPGLELAGEVGERQRTRGCRARRIHGPLELHDAGRERARLVAAQNIDAPEILDRRQVLHDDLVARHPQRALRERHGADHRQELRRQAHPQRHREQQRFERVVLEDNPHQQDEQH
jgi:hypothetical protein